MKEMIYGPRKKAEILHKEEHGDFMIVIVSYGTHMCAYIKVPDELIEKVREENPDMDNYINDLYDFVSLGVHGGLTYYGEGVSDEIPKGNYLGWDYAHCEDYTWFGTNDGVELGFHHEGEHKWTTEEIYEEALEALKELKENYGFE